jgi:hypothetical protein
VLPPRALAARENMLAWPDRFPLARVKEFEYELGCNPAEAPILMHDLSLRPIGQIKKGDKIIGYTGDATKQGGRRRRLTVATVLSISRSVQPVVKMRLKSGCVIRCTADHRWYTGRDDGVHQAYKRANIGTSLMRVCDPAIPELTDVDDIRSASWLAGFFDDKGSAVIRHRRHGSNSCLISFSSGDESNTSRCKELEAALERFDFKFNRAIISREGRKTSGWYWLQAGNGKREPSLPVFQRFLHVIKPTKWRERMAEGALVSRFISSKDRVVSIKGDGREIVYGLETTTGNYVVCGLASSNSGQYQQAPVGIHRSPPPALLGRLLALVDVATSMPTARESLAQSEGILRNRTDGCGPSPNFLLAELITH